MSTAPWSGRRLHFVGIGGAGMSGWASVAIELGAQVSGSDRTTSPQLDRLAALGAQVHAGHDAANLPPGGEVEVVHSTAVPPDNPELVVARKRGLRVMPRAELLRELTDLRRTIAVAGAHGKTTTTSMVAHILRACDMDPGYLIGGELRSTGRNAAWGSGDWLVVEADESDRSMLALEVEVAVVTNVELDHHASYGSLSELRGVFREFLERPAQAVILDRPELLELRGPRPLVAFDAPAELELDERGARFAWHGHEVRLASPGIHNVRNAVAALEACALAGADPACAAASLERFSGAGRRFELLGATRSGALIVDDYAHHPTEVAATLAAARTRAPGRLIAVFQPHLFSRTRHLAAAFGRALAQADIACVLDVYPSRERAEDHPGVTGRLVAEAAVDARPGREVLWMPGFDDAEPVLRERLRAGDLCVVMGAGDVRTLAERLVERPPG